MHIAYRYLIPRQIKENGITAEQIEFPEDSGAPHRCATTRAKPASASWSR